MQNKWLIAGGVLTALFIGGWLAFGSKDTAEIISPHYGPAADLVYATGVIEPVVQAEVAPEVNGRLVERYVEEGAEVRLSQPLARLFDAEQYAEVSELIIREVNDELALKRAEELWNKRSGSREKFDDAKAELEQTRARLAAAKVRLQQRTITAPIAGTILRREREIGETLTAGQRLFVIGQLDTLRTTLEVDEEDLPLLKVGQKVLLSNDGFPGQVFNATVSEITPQGDSLNKTYRVRALLASSQTLPVGLTVEANIVVVEKDKALLVPSTAVAGDEVYQPNGTPKKVTVGIRGADWTEIVDGLTEADKLLKTAPKPAAGG